MDERGSGSRDDANQFQWVHEEFTIFLDGGGEMLQIMPPLAASTGLFLHEVVE